MTPGRRRSAGMPGQSAPAPSLGARDPRARTNGQALTRRQTAGHGIGLGPNGEHVFRPGEGLEERDDGLIHVVVQFPLVIS